MSNSSLVSFTRISPNYSNRTSAIKKITIHHMAGNLSVETCGNVFASSARQASANYGIGSDGRVGMYVEEKFKPWTSSNHNNDNQAVTIEVANSKGAPNWEVSDKALSKLIELCVDICKRNGIAKLNFTGDKSGNLTMHSMFAATACPGPYLKSKFGYIAEQVNANLNQPTSQQVSGKVKIKQGATDLNSGRQFSSFVYSEVYDVIKVDGSKVKFGKGTAVTGVTDISNIIGYVQPAEKPIIPTNTQPIYKLGQYLSNGIDYGYVFDHEYYSNNYPDLKAAFGMDKTKLFNHFLVNGMKEERIANPYFDVKVYRAMYSDLRSVFGNNTIKYYEHFCKYGAKENRAAK